MKTNIKSSLINSFGDESNIFHILEDMKKSIKNGEITYDLTIGSPDGAPEIDVIQTLCSEVHKESSHKYAGKWGVMLFRESVAEWYKKRYNVTLDPEKEIIPIMGSKRAIIDLSVNFVNEGRGVLLPDICYPTYRIAAKIARGLEIEYALDSSNDYNPDIAAFDRSDCDLLYLNYPHNPTGTTINIDLFNKITALAEKNGYIVCHDNAYGEILFDNREPVSFLQANGAKNTGIEIFTFSKIFNLAGWRLACIVGNPEIVQNYGASLVDYTTGVFAPVQIAGAKALELFFKNNIHEKQSKKYQNRRDAVIPLLEKKGWKCHTPHGGIYVWAEIPIANSLDFSKRLWEKSRVLVTPGVTYGRNSYNCVRIALVNSEEKLMEAIERIPDINDAIYKC